MQARAYKMIVRLSVPSCDRSRGGFAAERRKGGKYSLKAAASGARQQRCTALVREGMRAVSRLQLT